jgi:hypothetical protein
MTTGKWSSYVIPHGRHYWNLAMIVGNRIASLAEVCCPGETFFLGMTLTSLLLKHFCVTSLRYLDILQKDSLARF